MGNEEQAKALRDGERERRRVLGVEFGRIDIGFDGDRVADAVEEHVGGLEVVSFNIFINLDGRGHFPVPGGDTGRELRYAEWKTRTELVNCMGLVHFTDITSRSEEGDLMGL